MRVLVANPAAAGGRVGRVLDDVRRAIERRLGPIEVVRTAARGHGRVLAEQAVAEGAGTILSLGGDGTHGEVAAGVLAAQSAPASVGFSVLPAGTGGDFCRSLGRRDLGTVVDALGHARPRPIDVGEVSWDGGRRVFLNVASCGASAYVDREVERVGKRRFGAFAFFLATVRVLPSWRGLRLAVTIDGRDVGTHDAHVLCVCNGAYAGGGMRFAPAARLDDGLLDVTIIGRTGFARSLTMAPSLYRGDHVRSSRVECFRGREISITPLAPPVTPLLDVDGEVEGHAPATFRVLPAVLALLR